MNNPFQKRATEYLREDSAFLSVVAPEPLDTFFKKPAQSGALFDRLCFVVGTPGSGKTTIATLMQFQTISTLLSNPNHTEYGPLQAALNRCRILKNGQPVVLGCRIPMESEYRDLWELPYNDDLKAGLFKSFLQCRAMITWINYINRSARFEFVDRALEFRDGAEVASDSVGGPNAESALAKAIAIERSIYDINASLVAPEVHQLPAEAIAPYQPFDSLQSFTVRDRESLETIVLRPLIIMDDVHELHPKQLSLLRGWLSKREIKISRWVMMRLDAMTPESVINEYMAAEETIKPESTINENREITQILLQNPEDRKSNRRMFRAMARSMADKYLRLMPVFYRQGIVHLQDILNTKPQSITNANLRKLSEQINRLQATANIAPSIRVSLEDTVSSYLINSTTLDNGEDVKLAMLRILMHRYINRVPQASLFDTATDEPPP